MLLNHKKDISLSQILWKIDPNDYVSFGNYETILNDVNNYIKIGQVNQNYYQNMHLYGEEKYSWDWGKACPEYNWSWTYETTNESINMYTYNNSYHFITFKFSIMSN